MGQPKGLREESRLRYRSTDKRRAWLFGLLPLEFVKRGVCPAIRGLVGSSRSGSGQRSLADAARLKGRRLIKRLLAFALPVAGSSRGARGDSKRPRRRSLVPRGVSEEALCADAPLYYLADLDTDAAAALHPPGRGGRGVCPFLRHVPSGTVPSTA